MGRISAKPIRPLSLRRRRTREPASRAAATFHWPGFLLSAGGRRFFGGLTGGTSSGCGAKLAGWRSRPASRPFAEETAVDAARRFPDRVRSSRPALARRAPRRTIPADGAGPSKGRIPALPCAPSMAIMIKMLPILVIEFAPSSRSSFTRRGGSRAADKVFEIGRARRRAAERKHSSCAPACIGTHSLASPPTNFPRLTADEVSARGATRS
jgi:hypothetical protein